MFTQQAYTWVNRVRAISISSLIFVICSLLVEPYNPLKLTTAVAVCTLIWMLTAPGVAMCYITGMRPDFRWFLARKKTRQTSPILVRLSKEIGVPPPNQTKLVTMDKLNAATDGTTLFITTGFEPYIWTSLGEAVMAHELAHIKLRHNVKYGIVFATVLSISVLFGGYFMEYHNLIGTAMGVLAFLTIGSFVFPLASRHMEYEADALASKTVGPAAVVSALMAVVPAERRGLESDTHPSVRARIQRLRAK